MVVARALAPAPQSSRAAHPSISTGSHGDRHHQARRPRPLLRVTRRRMNFAVFEDREIKRDRFLRLRIEPKKRRYFLHRGSIMTAARDSGNVGYP